MAFENASRLQPIAPRGWPERILQLARRSRSASTRAERDRALGDLWLLLNAALMKYLRVHADRNTKVDPDDLCDIAAEKALDLFQKLDRGIWDPTTSSPAQLCAFVSTLARNGLVDHLRLVGTRRSVELDAEQGIETVEAKVHGQWQQEPLDEAPDRSRFAEALRDCASQLKRAPRTIWFLRVFYEMRTKDIAMHPAVGMKAGAVDVSLQRSREQMTRCMRSKGFDTRSIPTGTFTLLWEAFRNDMDPRS